MGIGTRATASEIHIFINSRTPIDCARSCSDWSATTIYRMEFTDEHIGHLRERRPFQLGRFGGYRYGPSKLCSTLPIRPRPSKSFGLCWFPLPDRGGSGAVSLCSRLSGKEAFLFSIRPKKYARKRSTSTVPFCRQRFYCALGSCWRRSRPKLVHTAPEASNRLL